ncbi:endoplasmic reticulum resident protein 44 isoform X3 [Anoplolepis gracilipes]|uniref:endoplasmic reticulum resident protein 44 isoform X3 n=1 Tax=Anoplolepis gracilipes TaxID=354296 RepID=UPI003B9F1351
MIRNVIVGISGGVDSAVTALLLKNKGFNVTGIFMKNWDIRDETGKCAIEKDYEDARWICNKLKIPLIQVDFVKEYWNEVFRFQADAIATGHYANTSFGPYLENYKEDTNVCLLQACDSNKDQTFFLNQIPQQTLRRCMFPLGNYLKDHVKTIAKEAGLYKIVQKKESMGICFVGKREFQDFISEYIDDKPGEYIDLDSGLSIGRHNGIHKWTIGQRCRISGGSKAYYVFNKDQKTNTIIAVDSTVHAALYTDFLITQDVHWISEEPHELRCNGVLNCNFRFQHRNPLISCNVYKTFDNRLLIRLSVPLRAVTRGQIHLPNNIAEEIGEGALSLTHKNIDATLAENELVFINFYAQWCRFSNLLAPIFDKAADKIRAEFPEPGRIVMAKVDCDQETSVSSRFHISKYPTLKVIRNGQPTKREYRGQRSIEAFQEFIRKQLEDPIREFFDLRELNELDDKKRMIIGYFDKKDTPEYQLFRKVATNLKDDCQFHVGFGTCPNQNCEIGQHFHLLNASSALHPPGEPIIVFRSDKALSNDEDETYRGSLSNYDELNVWAQEKCVPLVREITFENAEELTEEGLPFLILFHAPDDIENVKLYKDIVTRTLISEKQNVNFLTADGLKFAHPLHHLGKSTADLPLIAIDSFRHMYLFKDFNDIFVEGKLKAFLQDLYSGKLHREFHYGPDMTSNDIPQITGKQVKTPTTPPESAFKKLAPSKNRYTIVKDEL